jgi:hypothetical protein
MGRIAGIVPGAGGRRRATNRGPDQPKLAFGPWERELLARGDIDPTRTWPLSYQRGVFDDVLAG